jgi:hypothetical protein
MKRKSGGLVDRFETIREAVRRIIELERTARNGLFLRTYVDLLCSDDESLRDLEYQGERAAYVIKRERPPRLSGRTGDAIVGATGHLSYRCVSGQPAQLTVERADDGAKAMPSLGFAAALAHEVGVHDPAVGLSGFGPDPLDVVADFLELARDQDLVRRTDIGAPKDVDVLISKPLIGILGVEHDDDVVDIVWETLGDLASSGDLDGFTDAVERRPVARR